MVYEFELQGLPRTTNGSHGHWAHKYSQNKRWKKLVVDACTTAGIINLGLTKAKLTLTRCSGRECDFDNLCISFKPIVDGLKLAGVIVDDKPSVIGQSEYKWEKAKNRHGKIKIKIETKEG